MQGYKPKHNMYSAKKDLTDFLAMRKACDEKHITHIDLNGSRKYHIAKKEVHAFMTHYKNALESGVSLSITEVCKECPPLIADFTFELGENHVRVYDFKAHIMPIVRAMNKIVNDNTTLDDFEYYILEKPIPVPSSKDPSAFTDGFQIYYPLVELNHGLQSAIRKTFLAEFPHLLRIVGVLNSPSEVYEEAILKMTRLMYGSKDPGEDFYYEATRRGSFERER